MKKILAVILSAACSFQGGWALADTDQSSLFAQGVGIPGIGRDAQVPLGDEVAATGVPGDVVCQGTGCPGFPGSPPVPPPETRERPGLCASEGCRPGGPRPGPIPPPTTELPKEFQDFVNQITDESLRGMIVSMFQGLSSEAQGRFLGFLRGLGTEGQGNLRELFTQMRESPYQLLALGQVIGSLDESGIRNLAGTISHLTADGLRNFASFLQNAVGPMYRLLNDMRVPPEGGDRGRIIPPFFSGIQQLAQLFNGLDESGGENFAEVLNHIQRPDQLGQFFRQLGGNHPWGVALKDAMPPSGQGNGISNFARFLSGLSNGRNGAMFLDGLLVGQGPRPLPGSDAKAMPWYQPNFTAALSLFNHATPEALGILGQVVSNGFLRDSGINALSQLVRIMGSQADGSSGMENFSRFLSGISSQPMGTALFSLFLNFAQNPLRGVAPDSPELAGQDRVFMPWPRAMLQRLAGMIQKGDTDGAIKYATWGWLLSRQREDNPPPPQPLIRSAIAPAVEETNPDK